MLSTDSSRQILPRASGSLHLRGGKNDPGDVIHSGILTQQESFQERIQLQTKTEASLTSDQPMGTGESTEEADSPAPNAYRSNHHCPSTQIIHNSQSHLNYAPSNPTDTRKHLHSNNPLAFTALTKALPPSSNHTDSAVDYSFTHANRSIETQSPALPPSFETHQIQPGRVLSQKVTESSDSNVGHMVNPIDSPLKRKESSTISAANALQTVPNGVVLQDKPNRDELPADLRNKMMRPTDCLLFAATLLEEENTSSANASSPPSSLYSSRLGEVATTAQAMSLDGNQVSHQCSSDAPQSTTSNPRDVDVLCGRGGLINKHPGNVVYRKIVDYNKPFYQSVQKKHRILVSQSIVQSILNFGGRFLILSGKGKVWTEIGYKRAVQKTSQALRERANGEEQEDNEPV